MEKLLKLKTHQGQDADQSRIKYVILLRDGRDLLNDPMTGGLWWTYNEAEAKRMVRIIAKDYSGTAYARPLEEAISIIAKRRYGIELKRPLTYENIEKQIMEIVVKNKANQNNTKTQN